MSTGSSMNRRRWDRGQGLGEFILILAVIAMIAITAILFLGGGLDRILEATSSHAPS
jgi:hypothetical protein